jgi:hypothetical protein
MHAFLLATSRNVATASARGGASKLNITDHDGDASEDIQRGQALPPPRPFPCVAAAVVVIVGAGVLAQPLPASMSRRSSPSFVGFVAEPPLTTAPAGKSTLFAVAMVALAIYSSASNIIYAVHSRSRS